jgi:hypothetical protein
MFKTNRKNWRLNALKIISFEFFGHIFFRNETQEPLHGLVEGAES